MRRGFVISQPDNVRKDLLDKLEALGCSEPDIGEVDMRDKSHHDLFLTGTISHSAYLALAHGRSSHYELPSTAGVGCFLSHLSVCRKISTLPPNALAIVAEGDCKIDVQTVESILRSIESGTTLSIHNPHVIFVGSKPIQGCTPNIHKMCSSRIQDFTLRVPDSDIELKATLPGAVIILAHCIIYTTSGAKFVLQCLDKQPVALQWDSALSVVSALPTGANHPLLWWTSGGASQRLHFSSIQDMCLTCSMHGIGPIIAVVSVILFALLLGVLIGYFRHT